MRIQFKIKLTPSQQEAYNLLHNKKYKYYTFAWSRQSGKSTLMKLIAIEWLFTGRKTQNSQIGYVCKNYILAKRLYRDILSAMPNSIVESANGTDLIITAQNGSTIQFFSAESGASLRGLTFTHLICDEFAFFQFKQPDGTHLWYDILSPTIKVKGIKCVFVSTPLGKANMFYEMYQIPTLDKNGSNSWRQRFVSIRKTIYDDGLVSEADIESIKASVPELTFRQEYCCEFLDSSETFLQGYEECFNDISYKYEKTWIGIDLSGDGTDATVVTKVNEKNECESIEVTGTLDMKYAKIAKIINESDNLQSVYMEKNGLGSPMINEVKKLVTKRNLIREWSTTNSSKEEIISNLAVLIAKKEVYFDENNIKLFEQCATFVATPSKTGKLTFAAQSGKNDDYVMSLAIALRCKQDFKYDSNVYFNRKINNFQIV